ncbi:MAG TPA: MBL fold metallo-hydrolase [Candidatus Paceibacterota bacterium]|nr:MBL fold metallo-hydrolase [Candidatus Paceibacterota bacterium]
MKLQFFGGTKTVTGANYLLEAGELRILVDCGLFQGSRFSEELNYQPFVYKAAEIDYVLITHSHADHIGRLPKLFKEGFRGTVITTEPTKGILEVVLPDILDKTSDEAKTMGHESLYNRLDMNGLLKLTRGISYGKVIVLNESVSVIFREISHILGAATIEIRVRESEIIKKILFSGDVGNPPTLLLNPIDYATNIDYLVIESAYGNRLHEGRGQRKDKLLAVIKETVERRGVLMIPSFALERTQELLLEFDKPFDEGRLPKVPIFVDSPLAIHITRVYGRFSHFFNPTAVEILKNNKGLFNFPWLKFTPSTGESKKINEVPAPKIIIAGSGMSHGGRILHHERRYLSDPNSTILFIGYQVKGSLGRKILDGEKEVVVLGEQVPVRCHIEAIGAYSAHADQAGLMILIEKANTGEGLKKLFIVQGEEESAQSLAVLARDKLAIDVVIPNMHETFVL